MRQSGLEFAARGPQHVCAWMVSRVLVLLTRLRGPADQEDPILTLQLRSAARDSPFLVGHVLINVSQGSVGLQRLSRRRQASE